MNFSFGEIVFWKRKCVGFFFGKWITFDCHMTRYNCLQKQEWRFDCFELFLYTKQSKKSRHQHREICVQNLFFFIEKKNKQTAQVENALQQRLGRFLSLLILFSQLIFGSDLLKYFQPMDFASVCLTLMISQY